MTYVATIVECDASAEAIGRDSGTLAASAYAGRLAIHEDSLALFFRRTRQDVRRRLPRLRAKAPSRRGVPLDQAVTAHAAWLHEILARERAHVENVGEPCCATTLSELLAWSDTVVPSVQEAVRMRDAYAALRWLADTRCELDTLYAPYRATLGVSLEDLRAEEEAPVAGGDIVSAIRMRRGHLQALSTLNANAFNDRPEDLDLETGKAAMLQTLHTAHFVLTGILCCDDHLAQLLHSMPVGARQ